jgi:nucleotide-binding universal stress UspA family protein
METIVVGVDGSECSVSALRWALAEARLRNARVRVVHAWSYPHVSTYHEAEHALKIPLAQLGDEMLDRVLADVAADAKEIAVERAVVEGAAAEALLGEAADAALLVVGSRGVGGFASLLLGSVSQQCAHHAPCPVVIVRAAASGIGSSG